MDTFCKAIESHLEWRTTLRQHIDNQVFLHDKDVANPHRCVLGRWIDREATAYQELPSFNKACELHEKFHEYAGEIARYRNANDKQKAELLLEPNGNFYKTSTQLVRALMDCNNELVHVQNIENQSRKIQNLLDKLSYRKIITLDSTAIVRMALQLLIENNVVALAVYQEQTLLGLFTEHGYLANLLRTSEPLLDANVSDFVETSSLYLRPEDSIQICQIIIRMARIKLIPVIKNQSIVGIISEEDLAYL